MPTLALLRDGTACLGVAANRTKQIVITLFVGIVMLVEILMSPMAFVVIDIVGTVGVVELIVVVIVAVFSRPAFFGVGFTPVSVRKSLVSQSV